MSEKRFPTARTPANSFRLTLRLGDGGLVEGVTVAELLLNALGALDERGLLKRIELPFRTSGENALLALKPEHAPGRPFSAFKRFLPRNSNRVIFINTNHPRFFGLRQAARVLAAAGVPAVPE